MHASSPFAWLVIQLHGTHLCVTHLADNVSRASAHVQLIPDIDDRLSRRFIGTPHSHARFLRRKNGTYGPKNLLTMAGALPQAVKPLNNMWCCGDSVRYQPCLGTALPCPAHPLLLFSVQSLRLRRSLR